MIERDTTVEDLRRHIAYYWAMRQTARRGGDDCAGADSCPFCTSVEQSAERCLRMLFRLRRIGREL